MSPTRAPRSTHIWRSASRRAARACRRHRSEEHAERVGVTVRVAGPVFDAGVDDVELEGEDVLEDVRASGGRRDGPERAEEVGHFGGDLVEEAEAGEGGEAEGPELRERGVLV
jgi:hypothetical protein